MNGVETRPARLLIHIESRNAFTNLRWVQNEYITFFISIKVKFILVLVPASTILLVEALNSLWFFMRIVGVISTHLWPLFFPLITFVKQIIELFGESRLANKDILSYFFFNYIEVNIIKLPFLRVQFIF
jgi:hypothetical protein